ncbi:MAG: SPOR domain-containing protein [Gammaproteobacteria bacterium]|nr:SPOR domain-containing protein [Gammaproteobacteria bacterium]
MNQRRLTARDFKSARRGGLDLGRWREFGMGLGAGLLVALVIFVSDRRTPPGAEPASPQPEKRSVTSAGEVASGDDAAAGGSDHYDFYELLPKFEVVVPEKERDVRRVDAAARVEQPGVYVLQAGSYRDFNEADRVRAQLARQDISATVQRVAVDADVWHRVRIGPIRDLAQLNRLRQQLQSADIDTLVIRVGD